jgi:hypothetical protein
MVTSRQVVRVCVLRPKTGQENEPGHAWLILGDIHGDGADSKPPPARSYRGYYPMIPRLPRDARAPGESYLRSFVRYFRKNAVPGMRTVDYKARVASLRWRDTCGNLPIRAASQRLDPVWTYAHIPEGRERVQHGKFGLDISQPEVNNCVSWVARGINPHLPEQLQFDIPNPPRVRALMDYIMTHQDIDLDPQTSS